MKAFNTIGKKQLEEQVLRLNVGSAKDYWKIRQVVKGDGDEESRLEADYRFKNFARTWKFLNHVALSVNSMKHHPTICTTYNRVNISLTTHDAGNKVTYNDLKVALAIQDIFLNEFKRPPKVTGINDLIKDSRQQFSFSQASNIIEEMLKPRQSTDTDKKENKE